MVGEATAVQDVEGVTIGHATNLAARTGCTVIRFDHPALTAVEVRGAAPGTRELDLLAAGRTVQRADAIVFAGGSAFGLAAVDGVVRALASEGRGFPTPAGPVPIVPAAVIYDLSTGAAVAPGAFDGESAYRSAGLLHAAAQGTVGAGTGATVSKIRGPSGQRPGGLGISQRALGDHTITAIAVVNAFGVPSTGEEAEPDVREEFLDSPLARPPFGESTTLVAVVTTLPCDHGTLIRACVAAHDAMARAIIPAHTMVDGDVVFASTLVEGSISSADALRFAVAVELSVEGAIRGATQASREGASQVSGVLPNMR